MHSFSNFFESHLDKIIIIWTKADSEIRNGANLSGVGDGGERKDKEKSRQSQ